MPHGDMWRNMNKVTVGEPAVRSPPLHAPEKLGGPTFSLEGSNT